MSSSPEAPTSHNTQGVDKSISARLRARRRMLGRSQTQLANDCGLSPQQIHKYETGQSRLTGGRIVQLSGILGVPVTYFFDGLTVQESFSEDLVTLLGDPNNTEALMIFSKLPAKTRTGLLAMLRAVRADSVVAPKDGPASVDHLRLAVK